jgi:hypothetical protein
MRLFIAAALSTAIVMSAAIAGLAQAETRHPCAADAIAKAKPLLALQYGLGSTEKPDTLAIDSRVRVLPPIRALKGKGRLDVLEVMGHIYRADYRMRFIYVQSKADCALMGQEIIEVSDPY